MFVQFQKLVGYVSWHFISFFTFISFTKVNKNFWISKESTRRWDNKENYECKLKYDCHHHQQNYRTSGVSTFSYTQLLYVFAKNFLFFCLRLIFTNDFYLLSLNGNSISFLKPSEYLREKNNQLGLERSTRTCCLFIQCFNIAPYNYGL